MPFIQLELDAMEKVPDAARVAGIAEHQFGWGLNLSWRHCWREKTDLITDDHLLAFFGGEPARVKRGLAAFRFGESLENGTTRIRGVERYLRVTEARRKGAEAANRALAERRLSDAGATLPPRSSDAPERSISEQRTANNEQRKEDDVDEDEEAGAQAADEQPPPSGSAEHVGRSPDHVARSTEFFAWVQQQRIQHGLSNEPRPPAEKLGSWFAQALAEVNGDVVRIQESYSRFTDNPHWRNKNPPWPFAAFMKLWRNHVSQKPG